MDTMNDPIFQALIKEAQFTKEMLGAGATQIRKVSYARKGMYFQALTSLSTGLERIGKMCLMLDYYIENNGQFPEFKYLKSISHDIEAIYDVSLTIKNKRKIESSFDVDLDRQIYRSILSVISAFAKGDRYSNIDFLTNSKYQSDPIGRWFKEVDLVIFDQIVTEKKKAEIHENAVNITQLSGGFTSVAHISETGETINSVYEGSMLTGLQEAVAPHRQRLVIHVIRFWTDLIWRLQYKAMELGNQDIPFFGEIFGGFNNEDSYIKTRKTWDTI
jgi:hypothetical protein